MSGLTFRDLFLVPTRRRTYESISSPPFPLAPLNCLLNDLSGDRLLSLFRENVEPIMPATHDFTDRYCKAFITPDSDRTVSALKSSQQVTAVGAIPGEQRS